MFTLSGNKRNEPVLTKFGTLLTLMTYGQFVSLLIPYTYLRHTNVHTHSRDDGVVTAYCLNTKDK